jgi:glycosyltransferase involved in cell wall biosynthesis
MKLTAIIAARNEALYLDRCCRHLELQGVEFAIIDNESTDDTRAIAESYKGRGLICIVNHAYPGYYDWTGLLMRKEQLARELESDWFMHLDADEIPEPPLRHESLIERLALADAAGYTAINFDEFVFMPTSDNDRHEGTDYVQNMYKYYFYAPQPERLIRAWQRTADIDIVSSAGHAAIGGRSRLCPENFVLRHYIALSKEHLMRKYLRERVYAPSELAKGWHRMRSRLTSETIRTPSAEELSDIRTDKGWDRSRPRDRHLFVR